MSGHNPPSTRTLAPDAGVPERTGEGFSSKRALHLHPYADDCNDPESLNALLARRELRYAHYAVAVGVEIILFSVDGAVWTGKHEIVINKPVEGSNVTGELRLPKRRLAREQ